MKIFNFHLMPYRHADLDAIDKNGSAWVTFSGARTWASLAISAVGSVMRPGTMLT